MLYYTGFLLKAFFIDFLLYIFVQNIYMAVTQNQIIEAIKNSAFTSKDYTKDIIITQSGIIDLLPKEKEQEIYETLNKWKEITIIDNGKISIPKTYFN